ncbi:MAG: cytochrome c oxidase assembly protein [Vicinamibacterales bacterium]
MKPLHERARTTPGPPLWLGLSALAAVWLGPLPALARTHFSAHMSMHMGVVAVAAPLIGVALARGPVDPVRRLPRIFSAIPASLLELVVVWTWHAPALHAAARTSAAALAAEQGMFLMSALLVWTSAFGRDPGSPGRRAGLGIVALLLTSMHMTLLGALIALSPRALFTHPGPLALAALEDQHLGGAIMLLVGGIVYLVGGLWLSALVLGRPRAADVNVR